MLPHAGGLGSRFMTDLLRTESTTFSPLHHKATSAWPNSSPLSVKVAPVLLRRPRPFPHNKRHPMSSDVRPRVTYAGPSKTLVS
jgi:hypothetical protein